MDLFQLLKNFKIFEKLQNLWAQWEIHSMVLLSLGAQAILTFLAPLRKRKSSKLLSLVLWFLYTMAGPIAISTISLIAHDSYAMNKTQEAYLVGLWAPFLILHLGGPDTITALQYEDIIMWGRQSLNLIGQFCVAIAIFARFLRGSHILLLISLLVIFVGLIKYIEKVCCLYLSATKFRKREVFFFSLAYLPRKGHSSVESVSMSSRFKEVEASGGTVTPRHDEKDDHDHDYGANSTDTCEDTDEMINNAYAFCRKIKRLFTGSFLSSEGYDQSRSFYLRLRPFEALKMLQIELGFMYDLLYTKAFLLQYQIFYIRLFCFLSIIGSFLTFCFIDKKKYQPQDTMATYILLGGTIFLDVSSMIMFLMSDWWVVTAYSKKIPKRFSSLMFLLLKWSKKARALFCRRAPESISQFSLLKKCLEDHPSLFNMFPDTIKDPLVDWLIIGRKPLDAQLANFAILELQAKARLATDISSIDKVCRARGNLVFQEKYSLVAAYLHPWTLDVDYDESLLIWHFATDICYWTCTNKEDKYVQFSKTLSDYMSYIMFQQQDLVSPLVGESDVRFNDTCEEVKKFMSNPFLFYPSEQAAVSLGTRNKIRILLEKLCDLCGQERAGTSLEQFCANILQVPTPVSPKVAKGIKSKSVLFDSCRLAKQLKMFGESQWEITSKVWLELLSYAAVSCSGSLKYHLSLLRQGGQLITLVWLLMVHLGFRNIDEEPFLLIFDI